MRFNKTYRAVIGPAGKKGIEILPPIRITFDVEKDTKEDPNVHKIRFWNLKKETSEELIKPDNFFVLYAGYEKEGAPLLLASGNVTFGFTYKDDADVVTEIEVADGYVKLRDSAVSIGFGAGVSSNEILRSVASSMGVALSIPPSAPQRVWANGFSFYGPAHQALHKVVQGTGLEWSIQNSTLQVIQRNGVTQQRAIVLASDSGMIGHPERMRKGAREKATVQDKKTGDNKSIVSTKQQTEGWKVKSLLLPTANPGDIIKIESAGVDEFCRIEKVQHNGDYYGSGDWVTELELTDFDTYKKNRAKEAAAAAKKAAKGKA